MLWPGGVAQGETASDIVWRFVLGFQVVIDFVGDAKALFLGDVCEVCVRCVCVCV